MSKPTHALVILKENGEYDPFEVPIEYILVDLSEESIRVESKESLIGKNISSVDEVRGYIKGYQQCAKDLLNGK